MARLEVEHVIPLARGGTDEEANLWLSCPLRNRSKGDRTVATDPETGAVVPLYHPRHQRWSDHFGWSEDGLRIVGRKPTGRATVAALHLDDDPDALIVRSYWALAGWHPPSDVRPPRWSHGRAQGLIMAVMFYEGGDVLDFL